MTDSSELRVLLDLVAKILLRCWIFGFALLLAWAGLMLFAGGTIQSLHGGMFGLTPHDVGVIHYCALAFAKLCVILFFFFPWLAIRLVLRKQV
jgi:hypothetical protein